MVQWIPGASHIVSRNISSSTPSHIVKCFLFLCFASARCNAQPGIELTHTHTNRRHEEPQISRHRNQAWYVSSIRSLKPSPQTRLTTRPGTSSIVDEKTHQPLLSNLSLIVETAHALRANGHRVIIVSSGAIGVGLRRMEKEKRPKHLAQLQALAAIGQCRLMNMWDSLFNHLEQPVAQILLTRNDIADVSYLPAFAGCV